MFENLLGGLVEEGYFVPVRFGLKHTNEGKAVLYVVVNQQKIDVEKTKAEVVKIPDEQGVRAAISRSAYAIKIVDFTPFVNDGDMPVSRNSNTLMQAMLLQKPWICRNLQEMQKLRDMTV